MAEARANDNLRTEKLGKLMWRYALPCVISMLVAALYNIVDQIFIANAAYLGSNGNAANTAVFPMTVVAIAIAVMIGDGCCTFVSINLGAGERERARWGVGSSVLAVVSIAYLSTTLSATVLQQGRMRGMVDTLIFLALFFGLSWLTDRLTPEMQDLFRNVGSALRAASPVVLVDLAFTAIFTALSAVLLKRKVAL